ncbi:hypothetical protein [Sagittula salina]|uniref:Uncharacterized protein n=1 Tax=Sagittula salina TaxID=2820268 RepID=A0A940S516_9RHOB|nr:hypothetical protein [Sagittula salina]MBP0484684.1 hypothetical protein [Sagittula salina]
MSLSIKKPAINLRDALARLATLRPAPRYETLWFSGDGTRKTFVLPTGWRTKLVYIDGLLKRPGSAEAYTTSVTLNVETIAFAVAPGTVSVGVYAECAQ